MQNQAEKELQHIITEHVQKGIFRSESISFPEHLQRPQRYQNTFFTIEYELSTNGNIAIEDPLNIVDWEHTSAKLMILDKIHSNTFLGMEEIIGAEEHHFKNGDYLFSGFRGIRVPKNVVLPKNMHFLDSEKNIQRANNRHTFFKTLYHNPDTSELEKRLVLMEIGSETLPEERLLLIPSVIVEIEDFKIPKEVSTYLKKYKVEPILQAVMGHYI